MSDALPHLPSKDGEPAWEAAFFFPPQGRWNESTFLQFHTNKMAELVGGRLDVLPIPNLLHQQILKLLFALLEASQPANGLVLFAPLPVKLFTGTVREPDLLYISPEKVPADDIDYPTQIDLAIEIVSPGAEARKKDYEDKRIDYAKAGISEYWIVDPQDQQITVLVLEGEQYRELDVYRDGQIARGQLLPAFAVSLADVLKEARPKG